MQQLKKEPGSLFTVYRLFYIALLYFNFLTQNMLTMFILMAA